MAKERKIVNEFGDRLKKALADFGISADKAAQLIGVSGPSLLGVLALADLLECDACWLATGQHVEHSSVDVSALATAIRLLLSQLEQQRKKIVDVEKVSRAVALAYQDLVGSDTDDDEATGRARDILRLVV